MDFPLLIFTDLDGTLLDHLTYSYDGAAETLAHLRQLSIPLVLTSSKTRAEIHKLQQRLELSTPFISENGGGIFMPRGYEYSGAVALSQLGEDLGIVFGRPYTYIRETFAALQDTYTIRGFGDMSVDEIMKHTGLAMEDAVLAAQRDFTEPFLFLGEQRTDELKKELAHSGLTVTRGGRFYHMMAEGQDKGMAVRETTDIFRKKNQTTTVTVALGDAPNDFAMLTSVDIPVLVPRPDGTFADMKIPGLRKAPFPGSRGWGIIVEEIIAEVIGR